MIISLSLDLHVIYADCVSVSLSHETDVLLKSDVAGNHKKKRKETGKICNCEDLIDLEYICFWFGSF